MVTETLGASHAVTSYGVRVADGEGRASMVAVGRDEEGHGPDLEVLLDGVRQRLPSYARPVFVRVVDEVQMTGEFNSQVFNSAKYCTVGTRNNGKVIKNTTFRYNNIYKFITLTISIFI